jgi:hypothetical protein
VIDRDRDAAPSTLREALTKFQDRDVKLAKPIHDAVAVLDRIESQTPDEPNAGDIKQAVLDDAGEAGIYRLILRQLGHQLRRNAYWQARLDAAQSALRAIRGDATSIHKQLKARADDIIQHLTKVAGFGPDVTLDGLVRAGRHDDAALVANMEIAAAELTILRGLHQHIVWSHSQFGLPPVDCAEWKDPTAVHGHGHGATYIVSSIQQGAVPWFPTPDEAMEAAQPIARRLSLLAAQERSSNPDDHLEVTRPVMA